MGERGGILIPRVPVPVNPQILGPWADGASRGMESEESLKLPVDKRDRQTQERGAAPAAGNNAQMRRVSSPSAFSNQSTV
jgi:hypothetical protein